MQQQQPPDSGIQSELESFRAQWRAEVSARRTRPGPAASSSSSDGPGQQAGAPPPTAHSAAPHAAHRKRPSRNSGAGMVASHPHGEEHDEDYAPARVGEDGAQQHAQPQKPMAAIDYYERAVEKEASGRLGDSLDLYRKAFRMDDRVDQEYKYKHFADVWRRKPPQAQPTTAPTSSSSPAFPPAAAVGESRNDDKKQKQKDKQKQKQQHEPPQPPQQQEPQKQQQQQQQQQAPADPDTQPEPTMAELIASFAGSRIEPPPPEIEGDPAPPCPLASLPDELLAHVLRDVAVADVGDFARLSRVCRRLAHLVATEDRHIWRRVCLGPEFGFAGMHRHWAVDLLGDPLPLGQEPEFLLAAELAQTAAATDHRDGDEDEDEHSPAMSPAAAARQAFLDDLPTTREGLLAQRRLAARAATDALLHSAAYAGSWQAMFRRRPRVRFNGCYISTVNYIRSGGVGMGDGQGGHGSSAITWGSPVHIVTYYRYLRLFRDGTALSLLTVDEPAHVVHHLTRDNVALHRQAGGGRAAAAGSSGSSSRQQNNAHHQHSAHLPSAVVAGALRGRWRMGSLQQHLQEGEGDDSGAGKPVVTDAESDLVIETEGVGPKYMYRMEMALRSAGRAATAPRNNKLSWQGFWSYNKLTDDWAEFGLKNDKPFLFSRVRSYGNGD